MPIYKCEPCNFSSKIKTHYNRNLKTTKHISRTEETPPNDQNIPFSSTKEHKMSTNGAQMSTNEHKVSTKEHKMSTNVLEKYTFLGNSENQEKNIFLCEFCDRQFSTKAILNRHVKQYCKMIKNIHHNEMLQEKIENLEKKHVEEKKELYKHIEILLSKVGNTTINNTQNIQLNSYGSEDLSHITANLKDNLIKMPYGMIPKMIEAVHFNDDKPENKNIVLPNKNDNKIKVFTGNKWIYQDKEETISDLVDGKYFILDSHYDDESINLNAQTRTNYIKFKKEYDGGDKELIENLKKQCELMLLNNR
jgi:hypothetical protein